MLIFELGTAPFLLMAAQLAALTAPLAELSAAGAGGGGCGVAALLAAGASVIGGGWGRGCGGGDTTAGRIKGTLGGAWLLGSGVDRNVTNLVNGSWSSRKPGRAGMVSTSVIRCAPSGSRKDCSAGI